MANDMIYQEQYIDTMTSNPVGEFDKKGQVMKGLTIDCKTKSYMYGPYAFNKAENSVVHGKQVQITFEGKYRLAYFYYGEPITYSQYKLKFLNDTLKDFGAKMQAEYEDPAFSKKKTGEKSKVSDYCEAYDEQKKLVIL